MVKPIVTTKQMTGITTTTLTSLASPTDNTRATRQVRTKTKISLERALAHVIVLTTWQLSNVWLRRGGGLWINNFTVQNCVRNIFISRQQKQIPKIANCQKNRVIDSFLKMH